MVSTKSPVVIIGNNFDLISKCVDILCDFSFEIACVCSEDENLIQYLKKRNISIAKNVEEFSRFLKTKSVDYLFSIQNPFFLPAEVLACVNKMSINCHNTLLPTYAGQHGTSWAIWFNETQSGITWHIISNVLDAGDIIHQVSFAIEAEETAFSLELKCQEYAKNSLPELIKLLDNLSRTPQNLHKRSLFYRHSRPCGFAVLDIKDNAETIYRKFRALYFGTKTNTIALLKFKYKDQYFVINNIQVLSTISNKIAGTIVNVKENILQIATTSYDALISYQKLPFEFYNKEILVNEILSQETLPLLQQREHAENMAKDELYWLSQFKDFKAGKNFTQQEHTTYSHFKEYSAIPYETLIDKNLANPKINLENVLTIILAYLYKINDYQDFSVCVAGLNLHTLWPETISKICCDKKPFNSNFSETFDYIPFHQNICESLNELENRKPYMQDLLLRYPNEAELIFSSTIFINITNSGFVDYISYSPIIIDIDQSKQLIRLLIAEEYQTNYPFFLNFIETHLKTLSQQWVRQGKALNKITLLSPQEISYIMKWNNTEAYYPINTTVVELLDDICMKFPNNIALESESKAITYRDLKAQSDQIAKNILYTLQVPDLTNNYIAVFLDKSIDTIITFIAVLKTGAAYIVLDPSYPDVYLKNIAETSHARNYITSRKHLEKINDIIENANINAANILLLHNLFTLNHEVCLPKKLPSSSTAYVIFTSGSTGLPKGVMIAHQSLVNFTYTIISRLRIKSSDKALQFATLAFDTSIWEIYNTLLAGATLYVPTKNEVQLGENFKNTICHNKISVLIIAPSVLNIQPYFESPYIKTIIVGGEACSSNVVTMWGTKYSLVNVYGPTECTVISTISSPLNLNKEVSIGKPLANYQIMICDRYKQPALLGAIGEIVISGVGLAKGYINNQSLTENKFCNFNFLEENKLAYMSGDLGKWRIDGELEYFGRKDFQLKIAGRLIDTVAIENTINNFPGVHTGIVLPKIISEANTILNAYILMLDTNTEPPLNSLEEFLKSNLPFFMVPSKFYIITYLPLTPSGKIDRQKLLTSQEWKLLLPSVQNVPVTGLQKELSNIWKQTIGLDTAIDIKADFFKLGGSSLQITQLVSLIQEKYNIHISINNFLQSPTIEHLEVMVSKKGTSTQDVIGIVNEDISKFRQFLKDKKFQLTQFKMPTKIRKVFLTGITSPLGSYIAKYFLANNVELFCLIRTDNKNFSNVIAKLRRNSLTDQEISRLNLVEGNLNEEHFGLNQDLYDQIANEVDAVLNCAAFVNHVFSYEQLKNTNVYGVWRCIELAYTKRYKYVIHISALSILNVLKENTTQEDFIDIADCQPLSEISGYNLTKLVSELCLNELRTASNSSIIQIYRPGLIGGDSITGNHNYEDNHLLLLIKSCLQMSIAPICDISLNIIPVDCAAKFIVKSVLDNKANKDQIVYNIRNDSSLKFTNFLQFFAQRLNTQVKFVPFLEWQNKLRQIDITNALYPLLSLYLDENEASALQIYNFLSNVNNSLFQVKYNSLKLSSIPSLQELLPIYLEFLVKEEFFCEKPKPKPSI